VLVEGKLIADPVWKRGPGHEGFERFHESVAPAGAMQSNVIDLARFLQMFLDEGTVAGKSLLKRALPMNVSMFAPTMPAEGMKRLRSLRGEKEQHEYSSTQ
jgi:CubicO group peptidase (beta-lactamase class C family)